MKIIMTTLAPSIDTEVEPRFGRAAYFLVVDADTLEWQAHANPGVALSSGAGVRAAQFAADQKADAAISGDFGPHAFQALQAAGTQMYLYGACRTAREAITLFKEGRLQGAGAPTSGNRHSQGGR